MKNFIISAVPPKSPKIKRDKQLYEVISTVLQFLKFYETPYDLEEYDKDGVISYIVWRKGCLSKVYMVRDFNSKELRFFLEDSSRIKRGEMEGFTVEEIWKQQGVMMEFTKIEDMINFLNNRDTWKLVPLEP